VAAGESEVDAESAPRLTTNPIWFDIVSSGQYCDIVAKATKRFAGWSQLWIRLDFVITIMAGKIAFSCPLSRAGMNDRKGIFRC
jgi:hypothetical protein